MDGWVDRYNGDVYVRVDIKNHLEVVTYIGIHAHVCTYT